MDLTAFDRRAYVRSLLRRGARHAALIVLVWGGLLAVSDRFANAVGLVSR